jgi:hypothetical protein
VARDKPNRVLWSDKEEIAFHKLKQALYDCTRRNLFTLHFGKPVGLHVDASKWAVGAYFNQWDDEGLDRPISFASSK